MEEILHHFIGGLYIYIYCIYIYIYTYYRVSACFNHPFGGAGFRWPIHSSKIIPCFTVALRCSPARRKSFVGHCRRPNHFAEKVCGFGYGSIPI